MGLAPKDYIPVTAHRSENVDNAVYLARLFEALGEMASHYGRKIIFPMHPRTRSKYDEFRGPQERKYYVTAGVLRLQQTAQGSSLSALSLQAHRGGNANERGIGKTRALPNGYVHLRWSSGFAPSRSCCLSSSFRSTNQIDRKNARFSDASLSVSVLDALQLGPALAGLVRPRACRSAT
jgi:hypothetical protein